MYAKSSNVIKKDSVINVYLDTLRNISEQLISRITGNTSFRKKKSFIFRVLQVDSNAYQFSV